MRNTKVVMLMGLLMSIFNGYIYDPPTYLFLHVPIAFLLLIVWIDYRIRYSVAIDNLHRYIPELELYDVVLNWRTILLMALPFQLVPLLMLFFPSLNERIWEYGYAHLSLPDVYHVFAFFVVINMGFLVHDARKLCLFVEKQQEKINTVNDLVELVKNDQ